MRLSVDGLSINTRSGGLGQTLTMSGERLVAMMKIKSVDTNSIIGLSFWTPMAES
jgi:hypothetical protein